MPINDAQKSRLVSESRRRDLMPLLTLFLISLLLGRTLPHFVFNIEDLWTAFSLPFGLPLVETHEHEGFLVVAVPGVALV
jgi:hypothetical protein